MKYEYRAFLSSALIRDVLSSGRSDRQEKLCVLRRWKWSYRHGDRIQRVRAQRETALTQTKSTFFFFFFSSSSSFSFSSFSSSSFFFLSPSSSFSSLIVSSPSPVPPYQPFYTVGGSWLNKLFSQMKVVVLFHIEEGAEKDLELELVGTVIYWSYRFKHKKQDVNHSIFVHHLYLSLQ